MRRILRDICIFSFIGTIVSTSVFAQVDRSTADQHAEQLRGNYPASKFFSGSMGMIQDAWMDPMQHMGEGQSRPGYSKYYWSPDLILPVRTREGMYTLINFPNWELIEDIVWGDANSFDVQTEGPSSILIMPKGNTVGVDTNMIVIGRSGNKYAFYVQSETVNSDRISNSIIDVEVVGKKNKNGTQDNKVNKGFVYADAYGNGDTSGEGGSVSTYTKNMQREDWIQHIPVDPTQFRFDIEVYVPNPDDIIIAPERVWRDNIFTYIDLGEKALTSIQRPIVTLIVERSETPVGFRAAGPNNRLIIVEAMGDMVMRSGKRIVCLKLRRADSDGLENAIYANTNDWDLQNQFGAPDATGNASTGGNLGSIDNDAMYEDVFFDGASKPDNNVSQNKGDMSGFFNLNSFSDKNAAINEDRKVDSTNNVSIQEANNLSLNQKINSLPRVKTVVAETPSNNTEVLNKEKTEQNSAIPTVEDNKVQQDKKHEDIIAEAMKEVMQKEKNENATIGTYKADENSGKSSMSAEKTAMLKKLRNDKNYSKKTSNTILELGTDDDVNNLEKLWSDISKRYSAVLGKYEPFYSIDAPADGQGKETFHLRAGPINNLEEGDNICTQLGQNGIFCSVVRTE